MVVLTYLALLGLFISLYFFFVFKGYVSGGLIPKSICRKDHCASLLGTSYARLFDVPNFVWGIGYYILIMIWSLGGLPEEMYYWMLGVSFLAAGFSIYLAYSLIFRLRVACVLCFMSHIVNIAIVLVLLN